MPTFAQAIDLMDDPERIDEYRRLHTRIWPEVAAALRALGLRNMRIWITGSRLFMTYDAPKGFDPTRDDQGYGSNPRVQEWEALMRTFQRQVPGARPGEWWSAMDLVFDLDQQP